MIWPKRPRGQALPGIADLHFEPHVPLIGGRRPSKCRSSGAGSPIPQQPSRALVTPGSAPPYFCRFVGFFPALWVIGRGTLEDLPIRVLIVDDHPLVRRGLTSLLNGVADIS